MSQNVDYNMIIVKNLLAIISKNNFDFPDLTNSQWDELIQLSRSKKIFHYLSPWILSNYESYLSNEMKSRINNDIIRNTTRNALIINQIVSLAKSLSELGIPCIFLKGAACLLRIPSSRNWRFLSDIDLIVPHDAVSEAEQVMLHLGYTPNVAQTPIPNSHHIVPYVHKTHAAFIEIHTEPYGHSHYHSPVLPTIWRDAQKLNYADVEINIPSLTDHIWILMRTDSIPRPYLPRLIDVIETAHLLTQNQEELFNAQLLLERAKHDGCPNIVPGMSYACEKYFGLRPFVLHLGKSIERWAAWSCYAERQEWHHEIEFNVFRNRFTALTFTTGKSFKAKYNYFCRILRYEFNEDRATNNLLKYIPIIHYCQRVIKDIFALLWTSSEYMIMKYSGKINHHH